jgi:hypothetical protein
LYAGVRARIEETLMSAETAVITEPGDRRAISAGRADCQPRIWRDCGNAPTRSGDSARLVQA